MDEEPRNAASEDWCAEIPRWNDEAYVRHQARRRLADDFVRDDRRPLISVPLSDAAGYIEQFLAWFEIGDGKPSFRVVEVVAVSGQRLLVSRMTIAYEDGPEREALTIAQYNEEIDQCQKVITFAPDDLDGALLELDLLERNLLGGAT